jgi:hypothetical protein
MTEVSAAQQWRGRPRLAMLLRSVLLCVPLLASMSSVYLLGRVLPEGAARSWWGLTALLGCALAVAVLAERVARRLLPVALLLKLSMIFPDRAPSRLRVARTAVLGPPRTELLWHGAAARPTSTSELILHLVAALADHDRRTRGHSERVRLLCDMLAVELNLDESARDRLRWAALLHDVGKMGVAPTILNKPGPLNARELDRIKEHPAAGAELAAPLLPWLGEWGDGILDHHERYDGTGYPRGKAGLDISLSGRLIGLVDAFETMTSARPYKKAMAHKAAREELVRCAGTHFDPVLVRAFLAVSLPRVLWAMGPLSFLLQLPFLQPIAQAGLAGTAAVPQAAAALAAGAAGAAAIATGGSAVPPSDLPQRDAHRPAASATLDPSPGSTPSAAAAMPSASATVRPQPTATSLTTSGGDPAPAAAPAAPPPEHSSPSASPTPTAGAPVTPSPAPTTEAGRTILSGPPSPSDSREARFELAEQPGRQWECSAPGSGRGANGAWEPCSGTLVLTVARDGEHVLRVRDAATHELVDTWEWTVETSSKRGPAAARATSG